MKATRYLLPVQGSDTDWYRNLLVDSTLKISVNGGGEEIPVRGKPITDRYKVDDIFGKFKSKYGEGDVKRYYPKVDVALFFLFIFRFGGIRDRFDLPKLFGISSSYFGNSSSILSEFLVSIIFYLLD